MLTIGIKYDGTGSTSESANYQYKVMINGDLIEFGSIEGHSRSDGWRALLQMLIDEPHKHQTDFVEIKED